MTLEVEFKRPPTGADDGGVSEAETLRRRHDRHANVALNGNGGSAVKCERVWTLAGVSCWPHAV